MRPLQLTLAGFLGIRAGLGCERITVDVAAWPPGLVALAGPNGAGKTTVLDNLHPYRVMPFRAGGYSPRQTSYYEETAGEALKELTWEHAGQTYRSRILVHGARRTKSQEAYLHVRGSAGWEPARLPDGTVSDGKTDTYDRCVEGILGSPEMFFTAAFSAQSRPGLSGYSRADVSALMVELLDLARVQDLAGRCAQVRKGVQQALTEAQGRVRASEALAEEHRQAAEAAEGERATLNLRQEALQAARLRAREAARMLAEARASAAQGAGLAQRRQGLAASLAGLAQQAGAQLRELEEERARLQQQRARAEAQATTASTAATRDVRAVEEALGRHQALLERRAAIELAATALAAAREERSALDARLAQARELAAAWQRHATEVAWLQGEIELKKSAGVTLNARIGEVAARAELTERVPCHGTDLQGRCPLLVEAVAASARRPQLQAELTALRAQYRGLGERLAAARSAWEDRPDPEAALRVLEREAQGLAARLEALARDAALAPALATAAEAAATASATAEGLRQRLAEAAAAIAAARAEHAAQVAALEERAGRARARLIEEERRLRAELAALPAPPEDLVAGAEQALRCAEAAQQDLERAVDADQARVAELQARARALAEPLAAAATARAALARLEAEAAHWTVLGKALGRDGIVALSIDDAGPQLSAIANELLLACYGPRFTVAIETQRQTAAGEARETFDIRVLDAEADAAKSVAKLSGGERIWINEAMTRAIALYRARQCGHHYHTLFADESDGALDAERRQQFVQMKRKVLEVGGYEREIFITHSPELLELVDHVVDIRELAARQAEAAA